MNSERQTYILSSGRKCAKRIFLIVHFSRAFPFDPTLNAFIYTYFSRVSIITSFVLSEMPVVIRFYCQKNPWLYKQHSNPPRLLFPAENLSPEIYLHLDVKKINSLTKNVSNHQPFFQNLNFPKFTSNFPLIDTTFSYQFSGRISLNLSTFIKSEKDYS